MSQDSTPAPVIYKDVQGFPGYRIGDDGSPWTCWKNNGSLPSTMGTHWQRLKPGKARQGYLHVRLYRGGRSFLRKVHRLVLEAFVGLCPFGHEAAHDNRMTGDNRLSNLAWKTKLGNAEDKRRHGTIVCGERMNTAILNAAQVLEIRKKYGTIPVHKLASEYGVKRITIWYIVNRKTWKHLA